MNAGGGEDLMSDEEVMVFNGLNGSTGDYFFAPADATSIAAVARGETVPVGHLADLREHISSVREPRFAVIEGVDPKNLAEAGWGVVFAADVELGIRDALKPLLDLRREQAGELFCCLTGQDGVRADDTKSSFLARRRVGPGPVDPRKLPYYLLLVGDPTAIRLPLQYQLDVQFAVGRLWFDEVEEYTRYASNVVRAERGNGRAKRLSLFGVRNAGDLATQRSADHLVAPLAAALSGSVCGWQVTSALAADATKERLSTLMGGANTPAVLFTASHGMLLEPGHEDQRAHQGALVCQDWPGPFGHRGEMSPEFYFSRDDLRDETADLTGLIAFHFACFSAGTPQMDEFEQATNAQRKQIAPAAFFGALPLRMLSHPNGALAVIGHVERAWDTSFLWRRAGEQIAVFESTLRRLMEGHPVGNAFEYFGLRYAELASDLQTLLDDEGNGRRRPDAEMAGLWSAMRDARNYVVMGDPAVRTMQ